MDGSIQGEHIRGGGHTSLITSTTPSPSPSLSLTPFETASARPSLYPTLSPHPLPFSTSRPVSDDTYETYALPSLLAFDAFEVEEGSAGEDVGPVALLEEEE